MRHYLSPVASAFPASVEDALDRALLILAGGALQVLSAAILLRAFDQLSNHLTSLARYVRKEETALHSALFETAQSVRQRKILNSALPYSLLVAITLATTTELYRRLQFPSGYWIPMTALLVLKPGITDTVNRAIARVLGTVTGAILASFCIAHLHPFVCCACGPYFAVRMVILWHAQCELCTVLELHHRIHRFPALARECSGTCNCAASCFMHGIRRFDCSGREAGRDFAPEGHLEEGLCRGSAECIRFGVSLSELFGVVLRCRDFG